jgi:hypothetical protein
MQTLYILLGVWLLVAPLLLRLLGRWLLIKHGILFPAVGQYFVLCLLIDRWQ